MLVYGIRCAPADLVNLPTEATADYYMDYGLLVFPQYTRGLSVLSNGTLNPQFWARTKMAIEQPDRIRTVDNEQPWISDEEADVVRALRQYYPSLQTEWYSVPRVATAEERDQE